MSVSIQDSLPWIMFRRTWCQG